MFSTTMNIRKDVYKELEKISSELEISISSLIREILLTSFMNLNNHKVRKDPTHYQKKQKSGLNWKCFHINFSEDDFRQNLKCRFEYRISLSKLLFIGFVLFIENIIEKIKCKKIKINRMKIKKMISYTSLISTYWEYIKKELEIFNLNPP